MSLSEDEHLILEAAGGTTDQNARARACAVVAAKHGEDRTLAERLLGESYLAATAPSFHLVPRGDAMQPEEEFERAYAALRRDTSGFTDVSPATLSRAIALDPATLAPLRMVAGVTYSELAVAIELATGLKTSAAYLRRIERGVAARSEGTRANRREAVIAAAGEAIASVIGRRILTVPEPAREMFHSRLDRRDTRDG